MRKARVSILVILLAIAVGSSFSAKPTPTKSNASLKAPASESQTWTLQSEPPSPAASDNVSGPLSRTVLQVKGDGAGMSYWRNRTFQPTPGGLYAFSFQMRSESTGGSAIAGLSLANRDFGTPGAEWRTRRFVLRTPDVASDDFIRMGQWQSKGEIQFRDIRIAPVLPIYRKSDDLELGQGETIAGSEYSMLSSLDDDGSNAERTLTRATAGFNSNRLVFGPNAEVTHRFAPGSDRQTSAKFGVNLNYYVAGECIVEASADDGAWVELGRLNQVGLKIFDLPASLFPAKSVSVRLRSGDTGDFQVDHYGYQSKLARAAKEMTGWTRFLEVSQPSELVKVTILDPGPLKPSPGAEMRLRIQPIDPKASGSIPVTSAILQTGEAGSPETRISLATLKKSDKKFLDVSLPYRLKRPGMNEIRVSLYCNSDLEWEGRMSYSVSSLEASDYGWRLPSSGSVDLWTCENVRKVSRDRSLPEATADALTMEAARNSEEAVQLVLRPKAALHGLTAKVSDLAGPDGAKIPGDRAEVWRVGYVNVQIPTDSAGSVGEWPDPLPRLSHPIDLKPDLNQPLWITVRIPDSIPAGTYHGAVNLKAGDWSHSVPIRLTVWNATLPKTPQITSALGLYIGTACDYQHLTNDEEKRKVADLYYRNFARHHISLYDPMSLDPIVVKEKDGEVDLDFTAFDQAATKYLDGLGFTTFQLQIQGMGGGPFYERSPGVFLGHQEGTPEYDRLFGSYLKKLQDHLEEKGWLSKAFVYWFDEPEEKDYPFVKAGMEKIHRYAPKLMRMLTKHPSPELEGAVDTWCPILNDYQRDAALAQQAKGAKIWWYICTGPKAPYLTEFIDHPATSMRAWAWLSYQYGVSGLLIWATNWWTSPQAFPPPALQNPYDDPMSYVTGYGTPSGTKAYWGNGDGRFIYPPEGYEKTTAPMLEGPVNSLRWEELREGIEDTELFFLLKDEIAAAKARGASPDLLKKAEALLQVPKDAVSDPSHYNPDPKPMLAHRSEVGRMIDALKK